jgi:chromosome partitioning protein
MSDPPADDLAALGNAIFERMRSGVDTDGEATAEPETDGTPEPEPEPPAGSAPESTSDDDRPAWDERADEEPVPEPRPEPFGTDGAETGGEALVTSAPAEPVFSPVAVGLLDATGPEIEELVGATDEPHAPEETPAPEPPASRFARELPRVMAIANQKGGVGKTTTAVNLGACLADLGYRVLVVDLDPQGNATTGLGINSRNLQVSTYDVVMRELPLEDCIEGTALRNLFVAPANLDLAGAEIELVPAFSRELKLRRALDDVLDDYDFVVVDCPPSLGLLTVNALAAATEVVVPIQCEYYALEGLGQLLRNVTLVQKNLNPRLELSAIILVMYDARTKLADQVVQEVRSHFGDKVCRNVVPRTVRLSEAPSFGQPIIAFDPSSRGAIAYRELAKEVSGGTPQRAR